MLVNNEYLTRDLDQTGPDVITHPLLRSFLALDRFRALGDAFRIHSADAPLPTLGALAALPAVILCTLPAFAQFLDNTGSTDWLTMATGVAAVLAILYRIRLRIPFVKEKEWRKAFKLTHTAFAVGCIPLVLIVLIHPEALFHLSETVSGEAVVAQHSDRSVWDVVRFIAIVSIWAGITEEFLYRGLLISVVRRWKVTRSQQINDSIAIVLGALLFALSHLGTWGPLMMIGLFGIGIGFGVAYIAIGERVLPLVLYHIGFDILSLSFAVISKKF